MLRARNDAFADVPAMELRFFICTFMNGKIDICAGALDEDSKTAEGFFYKIIRFAIVIPGNQIIIPQCACRMGRIVPQKAAMLTILFPDGKNIHTPVDTFYVFPAGPPLKSINRTRDFYTLPSEERGSRVGETIFDRSIATRNEPVDLMPVFDILLAENVRRMMSVSRGDYELASFYSESIGYRGF